LDAEPELQTARLRLRRWTEADHEPFAALNADPVVMEYFPDLLTRQQSNSLIEGIESDFEHPGLPNAHPLRWHVLYRISRASATEKL
jgi:RimJ/RimL family protein N-acetyltransferase